MSVVTSYSPKNAAPPAVSHSKNFSHATITAKFTNIGTELISLWKKFLVLLFWTTIVGPAAAFAHRLIVGHSHFWDFATFQSPTSTSPTSQRQTEEIIQLLPPANPMPIQHPSKAQPTPVSPIRDQKVDPLPVTYLSSRAPHPGETGNFHFYASSNTCNQVEIAFINFGEIANNNPNLEHLSLSYAIPEELNLGPFAALEEISVYGTTVKHIEFCPAATHKTVTIANNSRIEAIKLPPLAKNADLIISGNTSLASIDLNGQDIAIEKITNLAVKNSALRKIEGLSTEKFEKIKNMRETVLATLRAHKSVDNDILILFGMSFFAQDGEECKSIF
jgi:hypothetical protein